MKIARILATLALATACGQALASAPAHSASPGSLPPLGANRIVGTWQMALSLTPCAGGPAKTFSALDTFHTGGTLSSTDNTPQPGNGPAQGIWEYRGNGHYQTHMQFFKFAPDGTSIGLVDIYQDMTLDWRGTSFRSVIDARVLDPTGTQVAELCGSAEGTRVPLNSTP